ncbi:MAG: alpha-galactosidase [Lachnospiraceae bacterium]|nr:alpha-galactosidase [Lachnospiraceae bacterium]
MSIVFHEKSKVFHLYNDKVSYIMMVLKNGHIGQLYYGAKIKDREDFTYMLELKKRAMAPSRFEGDPTFNLEHIKQEYPCYGTGDYRASAFEVEHADGNRYSELTYVSYEIFKGKKKLEGLPATYVEKDDEAETLEITLKDARDGLTVILSYSIFAEGGAIARSVRFKNEGKETLYLNKALSMNLDLPDPDYEWIQLSGAWARERQIKTRKLEIGVTAIGSTRGHSSHQENPFIVLKRPETTETLGEAIGFAFVYSGNFLMQAEVDNHKVTRVQAGINPQCFKWQLLPGGEFQTPEAVFVYSANGMGEMSRDFHKLFAKRLARGYWRDKARPILINNWEATYFDFTEDRLVEIATKAKECGVELFVLDDGWFGKRTSDKAGLGDWYPNKERLKNGITGVAERIENLGMKFGLWFEPEMVNKDSDLYRAHPDWILQAPGMKESQGRNQYVLDFSRKEIVDKIYEMMHEILSTAKVSYVKWDMNRSITECYSAGYPAEQQGEIFHRYILGVYDLYERLTTAFPEILFESCASGGARFDAGLLYYAPQGWTSDDTDAVERMGIQYGTSLCYPVSSMGSHVSVTPNHQLFRNTPLHTRANVAYFGTFGYELDLNKLSDEEIEEVKEQIAFMKKYREIIQFGDFYRLSSPFEKEDMAWMVVSPDKKTAIVGYNRVRNRVNGWFSKVKLTGLLPDTLYKETVVGPGVKGTDARVLFGGEETLTVSSHYGDELMNSGLITSDASSGEAPQEDHNTDYESRLYILEAE